MVPHEVYSCNATNLDVFDDFHETCIQIISGDCYIMMQMSMRYAGVHADER